MATPKLTPFDGQLDDETTASTLKPFTGQLDGEKPRTRGLFEAVNDNVIEFANAAAGGVSALANMVKPGNAVSGFIDENIIKAGEQKQSDVVQGAKRQLSQGLDSAQGIGEEVGAVGRYVLDNPLLAASQAAGSFALPAGAVKGAGMAAKALGAGVKGVETAGRVGGVAAGAAMAGGDAAGTAYDLSKNAGATDEQATAAGRQASVIPALVGGVTGAFGAERLLAGAKGFGGNALARGLKSGLSEAGQEAVEEGVTQFEGQRAAMPYDSTIDPTKGVAGAAAMGGIMGFGPGAVLGAMGNGAAKPSQQMGIDPGAGPLSRAAAASVDSAPPPQLGFSPLAGTPIIYPDGSVALNSEQEFQKRTGVGQGMDLSKIAQPSRPLSAEKKVGQPVASEQKDAALKESAPVAPVSESVPLEQRSLDELRQAFRSAQEPAIRKTIAAEIRKRRDAMPDPLAPVQPQQEIALEPQATEAVQSQPQEAQAEPAEPVALGQPLTDTGTNLLGRGADPLQSIIQGQADERRAADVLRGTRNSSSGAGADIAGAGMANDVGSPDGATGAAAPVVPEQGQPGAGERLAADQAALKNRKYNLVAINEKSGEKTLMNSSPMSHQEAVTMKNKTSVHPARRVQLEEISSTNDRPDNWRSNAIKAGKVARSLGLDPKGKRLKEIVAEIDAKDEWKEFAPSTGTLNVPRAEMPQIKAEHRGAMVNFLSARGVESEQDEVSPSSLKPTQSEFSLKKVEKAAKFGGTDRSILVSSDGHVVDGHHQWLAKMTTGQPVKVIRLKAPIANLLPLVREFPSSTVDQETNVQKTPSSTAGTQPATPVADQPQQQSTLSNVVSLTDRLRDKVRDAAMEKATRQEIESQLAELSDLGRQNRVTIGDLSRLQEITSNNTNGYNASRDLHQLLKVIRTRAAGNIQTETPANVKNAPQAANDGQAKASPVEARAPEGGNAAADTGVPAAGGNSGVRADGVDDLGPDTFAGSIKREMEARAAADERKARARKPSAPAEAPPEDVDSEVYRATSDGAGKFTLESDESTIAGNGNATPRKFASESDALAWAKENGFKTAAPGAGDVQADGVKADQSRPAADENDDGIRVKEGKGGAKGMYFAIVDGDSAPGGPWDTPEQARLAGEEWKKKTIQNAKDTKQERDRWNAIAESFKAGKEVTTAQIESLGLRAGTSDVRWFFPIAARLFDITSRDIRPMVKGLIRDSFTDMGAKREFVPTRKALEAVAADVVAGEKKAESTIKPSEMYRRLQQLSARANRKPYTPLTEEEFKAVVDAGLATGKKWATGKLNTEGYGRLAQLEADETKSSNARADAEDLIAEGLPFKASAVDQYGLSVPEGYVRQGDMFSKAAPAAQAEKPSEPGNPEPSKAEQPKAEPDYLKELFGVDAEAIDADPFAVLSAAAEKSAGEKAKDIARIRESIKTEKARAKADYDDWAGRVYKRNKTQVDLRGDGPSNQASMSVGAINESRRRNAMEALNKELTELDKLEKAVATDEGAARVIGRLNNLIGMAQKAVDTGTSTFKTVDEQFQYMLLDSLEFRGPGGKGNITSNGLSKAMLNAVKAQPKAEKPAEDDAFMGVKKDEPRNLVAMHNLTADNLLYADSIGGIPVPSIGITKIDSPFNGFGDVTLIAPSSMVDPEQGTPVFDRDAWTARFPTMNFKKVRAKVADAFYERMKPVDGMGNDGGQFLSMLWEETRNASVQRPDKVADLFRRYNAPKMLYAKDVLGKEIKVPMRAAQLSSPAAEDKQLQAYWKKNGNRLIALDREMSGFDFSNSPEYKAFMAEIEGAVRRYAIANDKEDRADSYVEMFLPDGQLGPGGFNRIRKDFEQVGKKEVDGVKLSEAVNKAVPDNDPAYDRWVKSLVEPLFEAPTITVRGREVEPTLENIVDAMTVGATAGAEKSLTFGPGKTAAMLGKRFKSMAEIKADRDRVVSQDQENEGKKATEELLNQYRAKATAFFKGTDWRGNIDTWAANDASMEALAKAGKAGGSNADIRQALVRAGFKQVDQTTVDLASESIKALRTAATDYFEAKPQRAVKLSEFRAAVVPKGVSQEVKDVLTKNGIEVVEYNKKTEGARDAAIQKTAKRVDKAAKDILFMGDKAKAQRQGTPVDRAIMDMAGEGREANEILSFIAKSSKSPYRRQLAQKLLATGANPAVSLGGEMGGGAGFRFLAKYSRKDHEVTLSEAAADRAEQIFLHETTHAATLLALDKGGLFATQMNRLYESAKKQGGADGQYGLKNVGEFVAEAFTNPDFQKALKGMKADTGSLWDRFVAMVRRVLGLPDRQQDMLSATLDLGAKVMRENMQLRAAKSFRAEDGPAFAGADQTETPEFKRWFAGSKVVDSAGKPLVVYHGTASDFGTFIPSKATDKEGRKLRMGWGNKKFYFTTEPSAASSAAEWAATSKDRPGSAPNVMPVFLSVRNPIAAPAYMDMVRGYEADGKSRDEAITAADRRLKDLGVDGIVDPETGGIAVFLPEQIKSATGNRGTFDPNDPDIANFGVADAVEQIKQFDVKSAPKQTLAHYRGMALQALGRRQLVDLYGDEFGPHLKQYDYLVQQMDAEKNETGAAADDIAQRWGKLKDEKALAELMHDATLARMDPDKPMPAGYSTAEYDRLKTRFNTLSPEAKTLYREARDMYIAHYKAVQQAIKDRIERSEMSPSQKKQMMASLDDKLFKELQGVYFPLARFGQYVIVVKDANGQVVNVTRAETVKEGEQARKELQKAFPASSGNTVGKVLKQAEFNAGRDAVGKGFMADLMNALDEKGVDDELRDTVAQLYLSSLPDLSWAKHGIHRKGTPGFSQDARRAFAQNSFHGARYLAKLRYSDQLQDELSAMQEYVKAFEGVEEYDSIQGQQVVDEMVKRHEILMNPKASPVSTALTSFGFLFHMGLSPASAMVNLTQTALVAYPQMGAKWGFTKAGAALAKASEEVVRAKNDLSKSLKGEELAAFERAVKDGTIDVTMAHDLAGIAQGEDQGVMWKIRPVMRWASFMFHHAEKFNRQATFIAAYRLSKEANPEKPFDWHYEAAKKATYDGHFDYSAANRARIMQGNWQRVILLFKQYAQSMVYTLARNAYQSIKALDPKERSQARKTLAGILAAHAAAAGVLGLPIVGPLLTVASWIGGDDDEPWDAEVAMQNAMAEMIGPKAAEVVARGFSRLTPFDLSGRVALNKLILPDVQEGLEGKEWAESAMAAALGPVAGIGVNMARGAQKITEGDYLRGLEDMMPTALRGPLKAMRYANEGAVDKTGVTITEDVSAAGVLGQASGFSPSQVRRDTERRSAIYSYDRALLERRSVLMRMFAQAQMSGDLETAQEVREDIQRFNEKNPTRRITPMNLAASIRNRRKRIEEAEQGVYLPSKRRDALEAVTF